VKGRGLVLLHSTPLDQLPPVDQPFYRPGRSRFANWRVKTFAGAADTEPECLTLDNWKEVERVMTERYGEAFRKRFPTPEDRGKQLLAELARKHGSAEDDTPV
jgi:hypothetical protein